MDEGGFVLDYITPPGTSLQETNRVVGHLEQMVREVPEVESYSRRTGLQLGLAAVTEANTGDIAVKLKTKRNRSVDDVTAELRAKIKQEEPGIDVEFIQVLQDMIGDLSNAPEPVQIKLFSPDPATLNQWAPRVADAISKVPGVVDILNGIDSTASNPATVFQVNPRSRRMPASRQKKLPSTPTAILEGEPAATPVITNDIAYTVRVRYPDRIAARSRR